MADFIENTRNMEDKSSVWGHFLKSKTKPEAKCKYCNRVLLCSGGSTSSLRSHLKKKHIISLDSIKAVPGPGQPENDETGPSTSKRPNKITKYLKTTDSLELTVSRMVTLDGIAFRVFANSVDLRRLFKKANYELPTTANTIKNIVMQCSQNAKEEVKQIISRLKKNGRNFSLSADEWTSCRNRRYMNINLHLPDLNSKNHISLGLARLEGSATALKCAHVLKMRLLEFDLSLEDDIAGLTTDGASVMVKMGKCLPIYHQLCYAHCLQLAVLDVLYKKSNEPAVELVNLSDSDSESDDEEDGVNVDTENWQRATITNQHYKDLIQKVRNVVKIFRKSPTKNDDLLQKYVREKFGHDLCLILDCRIRWSSLCDMLDRFLAVYECIQKALLDLKSDISFTNDEMISLKELKEVLEIIKGVVEVLCLEDATLLTADTVLKCMFNKLSSIYGILSFELQTALRKRIAERYLLIQGVLKYLNNAQEFFQDNENLSIFEKPTSNFIKSIVTKMVTDSDDCRIPLAAYQSSNTASQTPIFKSFKDELLHVLKPTKSCSIPLAPPTTNLDAEKMVLCEMALHENGGGRGKFLTMAYEALITIKPTSVESERAFSTAGYFCSKLRSRLNDSTLDALLFLRSHYLAKKSE